MKPLTCPQLFAGIEPSGDATCFYCSGSTPEKNSIADFVKPSFTGLDSVSRSKWVCDGCVETLKEGIDLTLIDGEVKSNQKTRGYSWIITSEGRQACTKAHRVALLDACLHPPKPPFAICITDSGQKHLLYRGVVNRAPGVVTVTLEGVAITYHTSDLKSRLELCRKVCAATGKPAMQDAMSAQTLMRIADYFGDEEVLTAWLDCCSEPLTQLAVWLCPPKEECTNEFAGVQQVATKKRESDNRPTQATFSWDD
jgi:hypothetical protein